MSCIIVRYTIPQVRHTTTSCHDTSSTRPTSYTALKIPKSGCIERKRGQRFFRARRGLHVSTLSWARKARPDRFQLKRTQNRRRSANNTSRGQWGSCHLAKDIRAATRGLMGCDGSHRGISAECERERTSLVSHRVPKLWLGHPLFSRRSLLTLRGSVYVWQHTPASMPRSLGMASVVTANRLLVNACTSTTSS